MLEGNLYNYNMFVSTYNYDAKENLYIFNSLYRTNFEHWRVMPPVCQVCTVPESRPKSAGPLTAPIQ